MCGVHAFADKRSTCLTHTLYDMHFLQVHKYWARGVYA